MTPEDFLEHYGVKGMKWGVRKEEETSGRNSGQKTEGTQTKSSEPVFSEQEKAVIAKLAPHGYTEQRMRAMYGPGSPGGPPTQKRQLTEDQKDAIKSAVKIGAIAVVAGGGLYALNRYGKNKLIDMTLPANASPELRDFWREAQHTKGDIAKGLSKRDLAKLSTERVSLPVGSILKRVSTVKEDTIRADGFFASFKDEDVGRYKAVLPVYWKLWGYPNKEGHIVNLKANGEIKAPSPKETFDLFVKFLGSPNPDARGGTQRSIVDEFMPKWPLSEHTTDDQYARKVFNVAALGWANDNNPASKRFFDFVKGEGFNALIDMNDAGSLGDTPLRLLDGSMFEIAGHERLTASDISNAQKAVLRLAHAIELTISAFKSYRNEESMDPTEEFLEHFGVKGMQWGVRKDRTTGVSRKVDKDARKDAEEFARAKSFFGEGAGTRRKLIKQTVDAKSKRNPDYAKAFEQHLGRQDQSKHASKAVSERKSIDRKVKNKQRAGFLARKFTGEQGTQAALTAATLAGAAFLASPKGRQFMRRSYRKAGDAVFNVANNRKQAAGAAFLADYLARNG